MMRRVSRLALSNLTSLRHVNYLAVKDRIEKKGTFTPAIVQRYVEQFEALGFDESYAKFKEDDIVEHVYGYISGNLAAADGGLPTFTAEKAESALYITRGTPEDLYELVKSVERFLENRSALREKNGVSLKMFRSSSGDTILTTVAFSPYFGPISKDSETMPPDVDVIGTPLFKETRSDAALQRSRELLLRMANGHTTASMVFTSPQGDAALSIAYYADRTSLLAPLLALIQEIKGAVVKKCFQDSFANGVHIYTIYVQGATPAQVEGQAALVAHLPNRPNNAITNLFNTRVLNASETIFAHCLITFAYYFTSKNKSEDYLAVLRHVSDDRGIMTRFLTMHQDLQQEVMSERHIGMIIAREVNIVKQIYADFVDGTNKERREAIGEVIAKRQVDAHTRRVLQAFLKFNEVVVKHNFLKINKAAIAFRLDAKLALQDSDYTSTPFGIFLLVGPRWRGFHIRFTNIARGGVRMLLSAPYAYKGTKKTLLSENYRLAFAQMLKNKDIPEGGSKGTILVNTLGGVPSTKACERIFLQYTDGLLDLLLDNQQGVVDRLRKHEILFLGPDENTAGDLPTLGALFAKERGYRLWKSFTTGKSPTIGGIPHEVYGMTTRGIRRCVDVLYAKLKLDGSTLFKFLTGGPRGDLGGNEILFGCEKIRAIVDGSGVAYDPKGLDYDELKRLVREHLDIDKFDTSKLGEGGFVVQANNNPVKLPDGTTYDSGLELRNTFHFTKYADADVFIPCGGRPSTITIANVHRWVRNHPSLTGEMMINGEAKDVTTSELKYRIIVEGANLFFTEDARCALEAVGVEQIKDSTANKGGVTSSSIEVFVGLALSDEEFLTHMSVKNNVRPQFYQNIVDDIIAAIELNAQREVDLILREQADHPGKYKCVISDELSRKITDIRSFIIKSDLLEDKGLLEWLVEEYAPPTLKKLVPVEAIVERVPKEYLKSIGAVWVASNYVYEKGTCANELDFYIFMQSQRKRELSAK